MAAALKIPGVRFKAVCDIWEARNQRMAARTLKALGHENNVYVDYKEMLEKEKGKIDAVLIATPDFWHSEHTVACLEAGLHVYCEKEMSNTLEGAKKMVEAQKKTGKLLQIGHQRRSNPRYLYCYEKLLREAKLLGRIVTVYGQWNRAVATDLGAPDRYAIPEARLKQFGFKDMHQFRNWRWYKGLGGGPIVDLGSHQIDVYSWFLQSNPTSVMASGGLLYHDPRTHEWYDTVMVVYDYDTPQGPAKAYYQTQTTNGSLGYFENFMGDEGTLLIEFARGRDDGFRASLERFRPEILGRAAILYIQVSFEESYRRNSARYRPGQEESVLFHKVPDRDMLGFFRDNDWQAITGGAPDGYLELSGVCVPFVSMNNEPESTVPAVLRDRYSRALNRLRDLRRRA
jgi:predicted dehydrogenase